ncbi:MAG: hypothetical protein WCI92_19680 [Bacteroidota bacterium]
MKTIYIILAALFCFLLFFNDCIVNIVGDVSAPAAAATDPSIIKLVSLALLAVYEVVVRVVPSIGDYSVVSWVIGILKKISDTLNIRI